MNHGRSRNIILTIGRGSYSIILGYIFIYIYVKMKRRMRLMTVSYFYAKMLMISFPLQTTKIKGKSKIKQPWMTRGLLKSAKKKSALYLRYLKNPSPSNKSKFVAYRNKFKTTRIRAEKNYYAAEFCKC